MSTSLLQQEGDGIVRQEVGGLEFFLWSRSRSKINRKKEGKRGNKREKRERIERE